MSIKDNIDNLKKDMKDYDAMLLAVTKTHGVDKIMEVYNYGLRDFGENKVQELLDKKDKLPDDINWHLIGHLQTNKVNKIVGEVRLIHSVDSLKILKKINNRAKKLSIVQDCLLQINISKEESKSGFYEEDIEDIINQAKELENVKIRGLMTMAPNTEDVSVIRSCFKGLKKIFDNLSNLSYNNIEMEYLSMGMTHDYKIALEEGTNIIRVGSKIFGKRMYKNVR
ncbi:YggS family pyridoxal phosphate-dependent enzyme [Anaerococcus hydrogenalis]|uniref:Pyridoxal phosphate homeostasis protein n=1 Tax=Anaerococcus hydrogenalis TaxID=33029 RepID=A0A2N6UL25_9FIRM|nr:YggS family pyridoxal phosphate-dependent enzyme [Anaerococcus hydrogenalis]MDK7694518.1 YggS family pyridoxal phosphate-dependent enzyme [Anaerococcus hydrogenalis]MDK7696296.1 YggS family pyridoxal phosphate-dependent enzyme [Anaerococcus hydrogenalis]MDK7707545.1 YggS family pyridoxal phosphate-dependent enzyme [Anaerococcus hydrogenalis]PMC82558.1 YggS family pyridoxal phosphate-dependent enzyme [Anaerococcus hydrogenalis]